MQFFYSLIWFFHLKFLFGIFSDALLIFTLSLFSSAMIRVAVNVADNDGVDDSNANGSCEL